ncbi:MAG: hypothetical protein ACR2RL_01990 [Gammaproteobacteria bacterium]
MKTSKLYAVLGLLLLLAYLVQDLFSLKWLWLVERQTVESYKQVSGLVLASFVLYQWRVSMLRAKGQLQQARIKLPKHKIGGALAPVFFYLHAHQIGYAYLFLLSVVFLSNVAVGLLNHELVPIRRRWFLTGWLVLHVHLAMLLVVLMIYHVVIAFCYQ